MARLAHDSAGFLIGDPIDLGKIPNYLLDIKRDVAAIKNAVIVGIGANRADTGAGATVSAAAATRRESSVVRPRDAAGRFISKAAEPTKTATVEIVNLARKLTDSHEQGAETESKPVSKEKKTAATPMAAKKSEAALITLAESIGVNESGKRSAISKLRSSSQKAKVATPTRDKSGRFLGKGWGGDAADDKGAVTDLANRLSKMMGVGDGMDDVDPSIKAFNEVAEPMRRGIEFFSGDKDDGQTRWLRKIFGTLNVFRKDESVYNKEANKRLKAIEEKPSAVLGDDDGGLGIGSLAGGGLGAWLLGKAKSLFGGGAAASAAGIGATAAGGGLMAKAKWLGGGLIKGGKGLLRRIPLLGALLTAAGAASELYDTESSDSIPRREKDRRDGKTLGGIGGTIGGAILGAKIGIIGGPVGMAVGAVVGSFLGDQGGQIIGEKIGELTNDIRNADIPGKIMSAWDSVTEAIKSGWESTKKGFDEFLDRAKAGWDSFTGLFSAAYEGLKSLPVIGPAIQAAEDAAKQAAEIAKQIADKAIAEGKQFGSKAVDVTKQVASNLADEVVKGGDWLKNETTIGVGIGKAVELLKSEGMTRIFRHDDGSIEKRDGGTRGWRNNNPGNLRYGSFAQSLGAVGADKDGYAVFGDVEAGRAAREKLIFESMGGKKLGTKADYGAGLGYREKTLSQAIAAYAPPEDNNDTASYQKAVIAAVGGADKRMADYSPAERSAILAAIEKREGFKPGTVQISAPQNLAMDGAASMAKVASVNMPAPSPIRIPAPGPIAEAPQVVQPLGSPGTPSFTVNMPSQDISQNIGDRGIAHIVTGGMGWRG